MPDFITHKTEDGRLQSLKDHLEAVSVMASGFAAPFGGEKSARIAGRYHDIGKYSPAGQKRMLDPENTPKVDHSTAGAQVTAAISMHIPFAVAGHHSGLPDIGTRFSCAESSELFGRLKKELTGPLDYRSCWSEVAPLPDDPAGLQPEWLNPKDRFSHQFFTRMLFSCLVDADFLDTEAFMENTAVPRGMGDSIPELCHRLSVYTKSFTENPKGEINLRRCRILSECRGAATLEQGLFTLTVPTGGGKTISSLAFALEHACRHALKRVIYVVPYTSIIEQTVAVFRSILGEDQVLEHHANVDLDSSGEDAAALLNLKKRLATENWDAPIIVTTAVQFFESLFAARTSRCRKLHNIAESVIIFDEAQMLPLPYLKPCIAAISELIKHYRVSAVLCTATQPALNRFFSDYAAGMPLREICKETEEMYDFFRRVTYRQESSQTPESLAETLSFSRQSLCIVNTKASARAVFDLLPQDGKFHLSTAMTANHRRKVLSEIRQLLKEGKPCRVVSTNLIEAGVDIDFPEVWRELAGLDSIIQAGGRCNREGKLPKEKSLVHIFSLNRNTPLQFAQQIAAAQLVLRNYPETDSPEAVTTYFEQLYRLRSDGFLDEKCILRDCEKPAFRTVAENFNLIEQDTITIYIPTGENELLLSLLRQGDANRSVLRKLAGDTASLYRNQYKALAGSMLELSPNSAILMDTSLYDPETGLSAKPAESGNAVFI